jgi:hypothetical protein
MTKDVKIDRERAEGVYIHWETYPPGLSTLPTPNLCVIERVNGDCTVDTLTCTRNEAKVIADLLKEIPMNASESGAK